MKLQLTEIKEVEAKFIKVSAQVRYWEDAEINGVADEDGKLTPFRDGDLWEPVIDIERGVILDWPEGMKASFHFKVCDAGAYYLLDESEKVVAAIEDNYVPSGLCHGSEGWGDYIIMDVLEDGSIDKYREGIDPDDWNDEED